MINELRIFFTAIMFYTRIPVPASTGYSTDNLNKATRYLPLVGIIAGAVGAGVFYWANFVFSIHTSLIFCILATILLTGAFHEDAISDFCDGFGGGYTKEKILEIMKDSRIGTYGAIALIIIILTKILVIADITNSKIPFVLISAHAISRLMPVFMIYTSQYIRTDDSAKAKPVAEKKSIKTLLIAVVFGILPVSVFFIKFLPVILFCYLLIFLYFRYYIHKKTGGYTGDILGALQQITEVAFYVIFVISEKCNYL